MGGRVGTSHGMSQLGRGISTGAKIRQTDTRLCFDRRLLEKDEKIAGWERLENECLKKEKIEYDL
jgi:hypothetical protein